MLLHESIKLIHLRAIVFIMSSIQPPTQAGNYVDINPVSMYHRYHVQIDLLLAFPYQPVYIIYPDTVSFSVFFSQVHNR